MNFQAKVVIIIVGFRNEGDIVGCLQALAGVVQRSACEIFIAENGGAQAMNALIAALEADKALCQATPDQDLPIESTRIVRRRLFELVASDGERSALVHLAEMAENFGYAGAINAWLEPLLQAPGWEGAWILNPDTQPAPTALAELVAYAALRAKGMVGSCIIETACPDCVHSRGLAWRKFVAKPLAVGFHAPLPEPDLDDVDTLLDSPHGASIYVTRDLITRIGLMDERYFLYFEDLEWGCRAKRIGSVGYAHRSIVFHKGGTTIGSGRSPLAAYLEIRNRILFVREYHPAWVPWTIVMQTVHIFRYGALHQMLAGLRGCVAGVLGETGRPDNMLDAHRPPSGRGSLR